MGFTARTTGAAIAFALSCGAAWAEAHTSEFAGDKGYVEEVGAKGYVAPEPAVRYVRGDALIIRHRSERRGAGPLYHVPGCPPGFNGLFRGNMYCIDGRPLE